MMTLFVALLFTSALFIACLAIAGTVLPSMPKIRAALAGNGAVAMPFDPLPPRRSVTATASRTVVVASQPYRVAA